MKMTRMVGATEFKAHCLKLMDRVARTHEPLTVTKRGKPVVRVVAATEQPAKLFGALKGTVIEAIDIVSPTGEAWEAEG
jgi:prevent-host-death family protein